MILNVGCGHQTTGDVNVDLYPIDTHGWFKTRHRDLDAKNIKNFIQADAHHLPFRSDIFRRVEATHIVPHLEKPVHAIMEFYRVCRPGGRVQITTTWRDGAIFPQRLVRVPRKPHRWSFTKRWWIRFSELTSIPVSVEYGETFILPIELVATLWKPWRK